MTIETQALTLIRAKMQRPRLPGDLIPRPRLLAQLHVGSERKLTLISAMAGTGKTTLLAQWLEECPLPSAWYSLDDYDNNPIVFLSYLCTTIRSVFPGACQTCLDFLDAVQLPPRRAIIAAITNELDELLATEPHSSRRSEAYLPEGLILALDDYHRITEPAIHEIVSGLIEHMPRGMHLAIATRTDPRLPLPGLRARRQMTEVRSAALRFRSDEVSAFIEATTGKALNPKTVRLLEEQTEGWIVGLRLAALSMTPQSDEEALVQGFKGISSALIVEYLTSEVLARQSPEIQEFVLRTSILERFCAPLCEAVCWGGAPAPGGSSARGIAALEVPNGRSQKIIEWMAGANLFLVPLDAEARWYRYHHLFQELLRHELELKTSAADVSALHSRAGAWFAENGLIEEALRHFSAAGDTGSALALLARHRYGLMNRAQWLRLDQYLQQFSPDVVDQNPELLLLQAWLLYHWGRFAELPAAVQRIEAALAHTPLAEGAVDSLQGELSALRTVIACLAIDVEGALAHGRRALAKTPDDLWIVRIAARLYMSGALLMAGDVNGAYEAVYAGFEGEGDQSNAFKATLLTAACNIHWMTADLLGLAQAAEQVLMLSQEPYSPAFRAWGHYHLGRVQYQHGDLAAAEEHFGAVVQQPYLGYGICVVNSACGLALTHQALGRPERAREVVEAAVAFTLEMGNTSLLPVALAFQAELALMQGQIAAASRQAARFDPVPPLSPMYGLFSPHLSLVKIWLAQNTAASRRRAADLLGQVRAFCESSHTNRFLVEALALQALLHDAEGDRPAALTTLEQAIILAEPSGFIRLFVDLGSGLIPLLDQLRRQGLAPDYLSRLRATFPDPGLAFGTTAQRQARNQDLQEPLSPRELEVLQLLNRHLTNKEIAAELVVSPDTVKTHTLSIYRKLDVRKRQQAVARARELGILV